MQSQFSKGKHIKLFFAFSTTAPRHAMSNLPFMSLNDILARFSHFPLNFAYLKNLIFSSKESELQQLVRRAGGGAAGRRAPCKRRDCFRSTSPSALFQAQASPSRWAENEALVKR